MTKALRNLIGKRVFVYLDDIIIIYGKTIENTWNYWLGCQKQKGIYVEWVIYRNIRYLK